MTLGIDGKDSADEFLTKLEKADRNRFKSIKTRIRTIAEYDEYENPLTFRHLGDGIYEFKRPGLRLYAFYDAIDQFGCLILCTNGGTKNNPREQNRDIRRAREIQQRYLRAKEDPETTLNLRGIEL
jgi:putative component of toxin-antitoxin plasmid stabilization module